MIKMGRYDDFTDEQLTAELVTWENNPYISKAIRTEMLVREQGKKSKKSIPEKKKDPFDLNKDGNFDKKDIKLAKKELKSRKNKK